jgi:hypothetical protein
MEIYKPPFNIRKLDLFRKSLFLAGSIEMGNATDWQKEIEDHLADEEGIILNPRRDDWDESWIQSFKNKQFRQQVEWELYGLDNAAVIIMYFEPNTKSPISLLELGLHVKSGKLIVCCPDGYIKKGNVETTCNFYGVPVLNSLEDLKKTIIDAIK